MIRTSYDAGDGSAFSTQARRRGTGGEFAGRCRLPGVRCRVVVSPKGIRVLMGETRDARSVYADAVLGETLVTVEARGRRARGARLLRLAAGRSILLKLESERSG